MSSVGSDEAEKDEDLSLYFGLQRLRCNRLLIVNVIYFFKTVPEYYNTKFQNTGAIIFPADCCALVIPQLLSTQMTIVLLPE